MYTRHLALVVGVLTPFAAIVAQVARPRTDVPVRTVMLFSSGVGYFEHAGSVRGDGSTELRFKTAQINDILKSLVLQDLDGGRVRTVTYASQDLVGRTLRSFQVDITGNPTLSALLNQLRGARVTIHALGERISGTILGIEIQKKTLVGAGTFETTILNVIDGAMIRAIELPSVTSLTLDDARLQDELTRALAALSQARDQDKKPVTVNFSGTGERRVRMGYVIDTPIWKTSYRLILGDTTSRLQGWAVVDNQTESDWTDVSLSLVSGRPISFMMDLYRPLYAQRPTVTQEMFGALRPQTYDAGIPVAADRVELRTTPASEIPRDASNRLAAVTIQAQSTPLTERGVVGATSTITNEMINALPVTRGNASVVFQNKQLDATSSVQSAAATSQLGELFHYTVPNVTVARQSSAMIPIVADSVKVERLSIYNAAVLAPHPLNGVRLINTTGKHLLQGPMTIIDGNGYAGDARINNLPAGQSRLLSYGIDLDVLIDNTKNSDTSIVLTGSLEKGLLKLERKLVTAQQYLIDNKGNADKTIIIEHPIRHGWQLVDSQKPVETTRDHYRFQGGAARQKVTTFTVKEEVVQVASVSLLWMSVSDLVAYGRMTEISPAVRDAMARAVQMMRAVQETEQVMAERTQQIKAISAEQDRIRENMRTVAPKTDYYKRLLAKLNEQESNIERLQTERDALRARRDAQYKELEEYVGGLTLS